MLLRKSPGISAQSSPGFSPPSDLAGVTRICPNAASGSRIVNDGRRTVNAASLDIVRSSLAVAGNTMGSARKEIELETGLKVQAPIFIKTGETVVIDSNTLNFVSRA